VLHFKIKMTSTTTRAFISITCLSVVIIILVVMMCNDNKESFQLMGQYPKRVIVNGGFGFAYPRGWGVWPYRPSSQYYWNGRVIYPSYINRFYTSEYPTCWIKLTSQSVFNRRFAPSKLWIRFLRQNQFGKYLQPKTNQVEYVLIPSDPNTTNCSYDVPLRRFFEISL